MFGPRKDGTAMEWFNLLFIVWGATMITLLTMLGVNFIRILLRNDQLDNRKMRNEKSFPVKDL
jgi:hypothetical protein